MISKEVILEKTNYGLDIFKYYLDFPVKPGKNFRNPLYDDTKASCNIYYDRHARVFKMKDFGNERYSGDCFWFVAELKGLNLKSDFVMIITMIVSDLNLTLIPEKFSKTNRVKPAKKIEETGQSRDIDSNKHTYVLDVKPFSSSELGYWLKYGIKESTLADFNVVSVKLFESTNRSHESYKIRSGEDDPIFGYQGNGYIKLYRPYSRKIRFLYGGEMPEVYCFGLEQLPSKGDVVFITGGEKDVMSLYAKGFHAICFNSETTAIPTSIIEMLVRKFRHIVLLYDVDETGKRESIRQCNALSEYNVLRMDLPISGDKTDKDISDFFASGKLADDFQLLITNTLEKVYAHTLMLLKSCEIDYNNPPTTSETVVSVNGVPLGTYDNLLCITGGEGTGKSNFISAIIAGTLVDEKQKNAIDTLGLSVCPNYSGKSILHYDTEQSEYQLYKNLGKTLKRVGLASVPSTYHAFYLAAMSRKERLQIIRDSMDLYYHRQGGIHLVVIDGIADLIRSANDETESIAIVDDLYRLAGIYKTCIICVLHFVPNGIKLRGHIGSELQRKAAAIISIEKDNNPALSVVKAIKVRDGSPLDVPMLQFKWDKEKDMHVYAGEKSNEDKEKRKQIELANFARKIFKASDKVSYTDLIQQICIGFNVKERTAKSYISYMKKYEMIIWDSSNQYIIGKL